LILKRVTVGPFASNCYLVGSETSQEGMVIDPGADPERITASIEDAGLTIKLIVVTHSHIDHIGAVAELVSATSAPFAIHTDDASRLKDAASLNMPGLSYPAPPTPDRLLNEGDNIEIGDMQFTVMHTPGHSRGGISIYGQGLLFSGDTLFNYGIGRYDLPGSDFGQLTNSLSRLMTLPDETVVLPGHGPETTIGQERRGNPFLNS